MAPLTGPGPRELRAILGRSWRHLQGAALEHRIEHGLDVIHRLGITVIRPHDDAYPAALQNLHQPPAVLFARGRLELLERTILGIVGTRRCTRDGREFTHEVADAVTRAGGVVLSGLALGIDRAAHEGALPDTIAVLGAGIDVIQPPSHAALHERIANEGLLLTEYPPGSEALPFHFPERNRIIAALSKALLVVEAPVKSGALITAEHAIELGVDVLAVPGPPRRHASVGTNALIRDGAPVVVEPRDVLDALGITPPRPRKQDAQQLTLEPDVVEEPHGIGDEALKLWRAAAQPSHIDDLAARAGLPAASSLTALLELEILGLVRRGPGQRYVRV